MPLKRIFIMFVFSAIFLLGLALRSPEIISKNYLFGFDQGQNYMRAYDIAINHKFTLIGAEVGSGSAGVPGLFHGPGFYYLLAIMLLVFKGDPYGGLVLMWMGGVLAMIVSYITARKMFGERAALLILFLISSAPSIAPQSRFVWGPHVASIFMVLFFYMVYKLPEKSVRYTFFAAFLAGILYNFELALSVPLVALTFISLCVYRVWNKKVIVSFLLALVLAFAPMILFEARHGFMAVSGILTNVTHKKSASPQLFIQQKTQQFISNYRDSFNFEFGIIPPHWYNQTLVVLALIMLGAIITLADKRTKRYFLLLSLTIPITFLVFLPLKGNIWPYYLIHLHFVYIYALAVTAALLSRHLRNPFFIVLVFFYLSILQGALKRVQMNWVIDFPDYGGKEKILGKRAAIDYVYADAASKPFNVFIFMPPVYTWPYDYLFLTYAKEKYGYMPGTEKKGTAYLIIETDWEKPWSYKGWLENVIKDGSVIWERHLTKSDQIIQKREFRN